QIKVIYSIHLKKALTQREIERIADLRQPEVSVALNELRKNGFVEYHSAIPSPKGRPVIIYTLKKPISEIIMDIKKQKETEIRLIKLALDELTETMENI